jgi:hypothetical protein
MKKYSYRTLPLITRESYSVEDSSTEPSWLRDFAKNLEKSSVESRKEVEQRSLYDQISSIMGNKSKYPTVEAAVEDMQERSGISAYWKQVKAQAEQIKKANDSSEQVAMFSKCPQIKSTINNCIEDSRGNLPIPSLIERIKSIHRFDVGDADWDDPALLKYLNDKNVEVKRKYPDVESNADSLGKLHHFDEEDIDASNRDAWHILMPSKVK